MTLKSLRIVFIIMLSIFPICAFANDCLHEFKTEKEILDYVKAEPRFFDDKNLKIETIDFDSRGKSDRLVSTFYGTGGCQYDIFLQNKNGTFRYAGHAFFFRDLYKVLKSSDPNVLDILAYNHASAFEGGLVRYKISCTETKTLAVSDGKAEDLLPFVTDNRFPFKGISPMDPVKRD